MTDASSPSPQPPPNLGSNQRPAERDEFGPRRFAAAAGQMRSQLLPAAVANLVNPLSSGGYSSAGKPLFFGGGRGIMGKQGAAGLGRVHGIAFTGKPTGPK
jgi:hypothetical protein